MKRFDRLIAVAFLCTVLCFAGCNLYLSALFSRDGSREYRVEADRAAADVEEYGWEHVDLSPYPSIVGIYPMEEEGGDFFRSNRDYIIREIGGRLYRIEYVSDASAARRKGQTALGANLILGLIAALVFGVLFFVRFKVVGVDKLVQIVRGGGVVFVYVRYFMVCFFIDYKIQNINYGVTRGDGCYND